MFITEIIKLKSVSTYGATPELVPNAPVLESAVLSGTDYILTFSLPADHQTPSGDYYTYVDGQPQFDNYTGLVRTISGLNIEADHTFSIDARYTQYDPIQFYMSNIITVIASEISVTSVSILPSTTTIAIGATELLTETVLPENATVKTGVWSSSNDALATVDQSGVVIGVAEGSPIITFTTTDGNFKDTTDITVLTSIAVTDVYVTPPTASVSVGATRQLTAVFTPTNAGDKTGTWSSNNANSTVDANGLVTAVTDGTSIITFTTNDGSFTDTTDITVTTGVELLKAFPEAMGAAAYTTGGRRGEVVHVTNLNDSGTGSLRWALMDASNRTSSRTIVFDISGIIQLTSDMLVEGGDYAHGITIAGQSAPEGNITITGGKIKFYRINDIVVRYLKFRSTTDVNGSLLVGDANNTIFDHLTGSHTESTEVCFGLVDNSVNDTVLTTNRTFQNNLVHNCGLGLILGDTTPSSNTYAPSYSVINNVYTTVGWRAAAKVGGALRLDVINNTTHNHTSRLMRIDDWDYELNNVGNYHSKGGRNISKLNAAYYGTNNGLIFESDNYYDPTFVDESSNPVSGNISDFPWVDFAGNRDTAVPPTSFTDNAFPYNNPETLNILSNSQLKTQVIPFVGCYKYINDSGVVVENRDAFDTDAINQTITQSLSENTVGLYDLTLGEIPTQNNTRPVGFYVSNPHIPEAYLIAKGLPQNATVHNDLNPTGYTYLEQYLNQVDN